MLTNIFAVFIGGGLGAILRYLTGIIISRSFVINFPVSTLFVNIIGSFIIGALFILFLEKAETNTALKLALTVGFCGGLTTFSTFSLDTLDMLSNQRFFEAFVYIVASVIICLLVAYLGVVFCKSLTN